MKYRSIPNDRLTHDASGHVPHRIRTIVAETCSKWCFVRLIEVPDGRFVSVEAREAYLVGETAIVPSVCAGGTAAEINDLIAALQSMREHL
jgi:hypothetical protein